MMLLIYFYFFPECQRITRNHRMCKIFYNFYSFLIFSITYIFYTGCITTWIYFRNLIFPNIIYSAFYNILNNDYSSSLLQFYGRRLLFIQASSLLILEMLHIYWLSIMINVVRNKIFRKLEFHETKRDFVR